MGNSNKNNDKQKEKEKKPIDKIDTSLLREIELKPPIKQAMVSPLFGEEPVQMEVPLTETMIRSSFPPPETKPRNKILKKADELLVKVRRLTKSYEYEAALQQLNKIINLLKDTDHVQELANTFLYSGHILNTIRKYDEAKLLLNDGITALKGTEYESSNTMADLKLELGIALQKLAHSDEALDVLTSAGDIYKNNGNHTGFIRTLWNKGIIYYNLQNWQKAIEIYLEIAKIYSDDPKAMARRLKSLQRIADLIQMVGGLGKDEFDLTPYLHEITQMRDEYKEALAHELRSMTKTGELERIKAEEARDPANLALWHFNLAAAEVAVPSGDLSSAINHYNKAIELYEEIGDKLGLSQCYYHLAIIKENQGKLQDAINLLRKCIALREDLKESMSLEEYRTAIQAETIPIYDSLSYLEAKLHNYHASLNAIEQSKSRELINYLSNEDLNTCPYVKDLMEEEEKALRTLRSLENQLYNFGMRYSEVVRRGGKIPSMLQEKQQLEEDIAAIHAQLQEIRHDIWLKCIDSGNVKPPIQYDILTKVLEIFKKEKNWAILEFVWEPKRSEIMAYWIVNDTIKLFSKSLNFQELKSLLNDYKTALIKEDVSALEKSALAFSEKIIPPEIYTELTNLENIQYLFIVPHKELHAIPFEIITYKGQYWGQKYCIVKNFSLDLARITLQKRMKFQEAHKKVSNAALIIGNPTFDLPNAEVEAREVHRMLKEKGFKVKLLLRNKSKEVVFVKNAKNNNIIHYAGHGIFITPEPILSHLAFASSDLTAREITHLHLKNIPIVILSACETAISGYLGGNELIGFVRSFIIAGATTIITTNWQVHDDSAQELIVKFYEFLLMGASVGIALQKARQFIAQKYNNQIIHWAAYTIFGDPFRRLIIKSIN